MNFRPPIAIFLTTAMTAAAQQPPPIAQWNGPHGGVPPWNEVRPERLAEDVRAAIVLTQNEIDDIATRSAAPTFENTVEALERAGETLRRVAAMYYVHTSNLNVGPIADVEREVEPLMAEHEDAVYQNAALFDRLKTIYDDRDELDDDQRRLVEELYRTFRRRGADLDDSGKARLSQINARLSRLFTDFSQNVLEEEKRYVTWIDDRSRLDGLPESVIDAMRSAAKDRDDREGSYAVTNTRSSMDPFLTYADDRELRKTVWTNYYSRGDHGDTFDNNAIIREILGLRAERATLLGYFTHAHWRMEPTMAKTPEAAVELMMSVWPKAVERVREEVADMQSVADAAGDDITIEPWDYRYYAEKVRADRFDLDMNEVKAYLQLDRLVEGMMFAAGELFGLRFEIVRDVPVFHEDVTTYRVGDAEGRFVGLWYLDPYAREGKRSGAWMTDYREQSRLDGEVRPLVSNNSNFIPVDEGPTLISWDDATTLFHEFGHALHSLLSDVRYRSLAGTNVARDYVEFPSQLNEHWLDTDEVLRRYAVHHETGEPMPESLLAKIKRAGTFNQGFETVEYLASAIVDMRLHLAGSRPIDPDAFERETLAEIGMPDEIPMRHRTPHFAHIFSSDAYSAGYYSYLWSDALTADAAELFAERGYYDPATAESLRRNVLSVGDTIDPAEGFRRFRGRDVDTGALMRKRGFE